MVLALAAPDETISLDRPVGTDGMGRLGDLVADGAGLDPVAESLRKLAREEVERALDSLTPRQRIVVVRRYGLDGTSPGTLAAIGHEIGMSREKVRAIQRRAMSRLRHPSIGVDLSALLD